MRHRVDKHYFGRNTKQRQGLLKSLVREFVLQTEVVTTETKAKELKRLMDKMIHRAKTDDVATRRRLHEFFGKRDVVNTLVDRIAPLFKNRVSGFTRIAKLGKRRGDNASMVKISLLEKPSVTGTLKSPAKAVVAPKNKGVAPTKVTATKKSEEAAVVSKKSKPAVNQVDAKLATKVAGGKTTRSVRTTSPRKTISQKGK